MRLVSYRKHYIHSDCCTPPTGPGPFHRLGPWIQPFPQLASWPKTFLTLHPCLQSFLEQSYWLQTSPHPIIFRHNLVHHPQSYVQLSLWQHYPVISKIFTPIHQQSLLQALSMFLPITLEDISLAVPKPL